MKKPNNNKERHSGWNEMGEHFDVLTGEELKFMERDSENPKLIPTILYKKRELKDAYSNNVDEKYKDNDYY